MNNKRRFNNYIKGNGNSIVITFSQGSNSSPVQAPVIEEYVSNNTTRTEKIVELMERFRKKYQKALDKPIIRCYGLFSDLAMVENTIGDRSDRSLLLSKEKEEFEASIKSQFPIKQIVSLDVNYIIGSRGYSLEKYRDRAGMLTNQLKHFENNKNLSVVFDYEHRKCNRFILGDDWLIDAIEMDKHVGYTKTLFSNNEQLIKKKITQFDTWFLELQSELDILMRQLNSPNLDIISKQLSRIRELRYQTNNT